jgi:hypothetical protein
VILSKSNRQLDDYWTQKQYYERYTKNDWEDDLGHERRSIIFGKGKAIIGGEESSYKEIIDSALKDKYKLFRYLSNGLKSERQSQKLFVEFLAICSLPDERFSCASSTFSSRCSTISFLIVTISARFETLEYNMKKFASVKGGPNTV